MKGEKMMSMESYWEVTAVSVWERVGKSSVVISDVNGDKQMWTDIRNTCQSKMTEQSNRLDVVNKERVVKCEG